MQFDPLRSPAMVHSWYRLQQALKARRAALQDLPAGVAGSRRAPWSVPKVIMGVGLAVALAGVFIKGLIVLVGAGLFTFGLLLAIAGSVLAEMRGR